jgi:phage FluMu gp28-like protein
VQVAEFPFTAQSVSRLALRLHAVIRDHALELPADEELLDELANVLLRETSPGVYRLDHDAGRHDDRAIAVALAVDALLGDGRWQATQTPPGFVRVSDSEWAVSARERGWDGTVGPALRPGQSLSACA